MKLDYLRKELVDTHTYIQASEHCTTNKKINGRDVTLHGKTSPRAYVILEYKVWDDEEKEYVTVLLGASGSFKRHELRQDDDSVLYERAYEKALISPEFTMVIQDTNTPVNTIAINMMNAHSSCLRKDFMLNEQELGFYDSFNSPKYHARYPDDWKYFNVY